MTATETTRVDCALAEMMGAVFARYRGAHPPAVAIERDPALWRRLDDLGLVRLTGPAKFGGSEAGWYEAAELLTAAARHAVRVPLAEHDLLACWLLDTTDTPCDDRVRTVASLGSDGVAHDVPWASAADRVVVLWSADRAYRLADVDAAALRITPGRNLIGEPRDGVAVDPADLTASSRPVDERVVDRLRLKAALVRSLQICAALDRIVELSVEHVTSRVQFGRPLAGFQAVAHLISDIAAEAALARAATEAALDAAVGSEWAAHDLDFRVAVARSCAGHAATVVVRSAHQVHGAIGTTREHRLHEYTRAVLSWRSEFGSMREWDERVSEAAVRAGEAGLWGLIAG